MCGVKNLFILAKPLLSLFIICLALINGNAQYFGRNKVLYRDFDFRVEQTPHFDIYNYLKDEAAKKRFAKITEQWYSMHQLVLKDTFLDRNPLIIYNHHAHFQQTRAIGGSIDVGTGGVTEGLKNRVVMPFMESSAQTDHVLGHELVHAFQYHLVKDSLSLNALQNLPLWMVEGMAEYLSTGYVDANTAMWLRSNLQANQLPSLKDLTNRPDLYFPYRWGEAFWAYVSGLYGDQVIKPLFMETARHGYEEALKRVIGIDEKTFSSQWQQAIRNTYGPFQKNTSAVATGVSIVNNENAGKLNIVPSISPDGKYIAYWTEKNLFSLDLYIADAATGKNQKRITRNSFNSHIDQYSSYESSVAWSPDSRRLALVAFAKGRNRMIIAGSEGKILEQLDLPGLEGFSNPSWSPDGNSIVVTGMAEGQSDLYLYHLQTKTLKNLTNDGYSDLQPCFSPDGRSIVFTSDRQEVDLLEIRHSFSHQIFILDLASGRLTKLDMFRGANNFNPVYGPDNTIYFLSDRDGFRNLYSYDIFSKQVHQLTDLFTGISGITSFAPAISVSFATGQLVYSYYSGNTYNIYSAPVSSFKKKPVDGNEVNRKAAQLPPFERKGSDIVQSNLQSPPALASEQAVSRNLPYKSKFELDYIGNTGVGLQTGSGYGAGISGGVNGIFSDMLGNNQLFGALSLSGELLNVAGQFAYFNQKSRVNWGASLSHIPYLSGAQYLFFDTLVNNSGDSTLVLNNTLDLLRTFEDQVSIFGSYPISTIRRVEAGASYARYYYRLDRYTDYYDPGGTVYLGNTREKQPVPEGFDFGNTYIALVGDNSFFGVASPLAGHRFRLQASQYFGVLKMSSLLADYRKYFRLAPLTLATRNLFMGRYGQDAKTGILPPLYLGYPTLVRGYDALEYAENTSNSLSINDLVGNKMYVGNIELRLPLTGPEKLSTIKSRFLFTELNLFMDAGRAWGFRETVPGVDPKDPVIVLKNNRWIFSTGLSLRLNLFNYLVIEPYFAIPWQNGGFRNSNFGFNFVPGW
jgi:hypothetical protein